MKFARFTLRYFNFSLAHYKRGATMERVVERFLKYVKYDTVSMEDVTGYPSTPGQLVLLRDIAAELKDIGMKDVTMDEYGYVFATLPSNTDKEVPVIGFIAHVDTSSQAPGNNINTQIIENYSGGDIVLNKDQKMILSPAEYPELKEYIGQTIITTDGTTLLGADDKAGVAEIISAVEYLINHPEIKHGTIKVGFTPDEETGRGTEYFDVKKFNADFGYTVDGGALGELEYECFNGAKAVVVINGKSTHPGMAKGIMVNSISVGAEFMDLLPVNETPETTEKYEGYYHIHNIDGSIEKTVMKYILRDFDSQGLERRKEFVKTVADDLNSKYGAGTVELEITDQYRNMAEKVNKHKHIIDTAFKAMEELGIKPSINPIRGGTDGARLTDMGLPCPNIFTGGHNFHGRYEYIPAQSMKKATDVILKIIELYTNR